MASNVLSPQDLVRQAVIEVANLPEQELLQVLAYIGLLKEQHGGAEASEVAAIRAEADRLAAGMKGQARADVMMQFQATLNAIRAQAIAQGTAIDGEWLRD